MKAQSIQILLTVALFLTYQAVAETPSEITKQLASESPVVRQLLDDYPELPRSWTEGFWSDALLRGRQIPGSSWRSHDLRRPQPSQADFDSLNCEPRPAPPGAVVLFGGHNLSEWTGPLDQWRVNDGSMTPRGEKPNRLLSVRSFGSSLVHIEFMTPAPAVGNWQYRGNSGVFLMGLYEVQILDSWDNPVYPDGMLGALYGQHPPLFNASLPPGRWQCLEIDFSAPVFEAGALVSPARATVTINGLLVQENTAFFGPTGFQAWRDYKGHAPKLPLSLQDHGDGSATRFRNIWVQEKTSGR